MWIDWGLVLFTALTIGLVVVLAHWPGHKRAQRRGRVRVRGRRHG